MPWAQTTWRRSSTARPRASTLASNRPRPSAGPGGLGGQAVPKDLVAAVEEPHRVVLLGDEAAEKLAGADVDRMVREDVVEEPQGLLGARHRQHTELLGLDVVGPRRAGDLHPPRDRGLVGRITSKPSSLMRRAKVRPCSPSRRATVRSLASSTGSGVASAHASR